MIRYLIAALVAVFSFPAAGQNACGPREKMVATLLERYGEHPVSAGLEYSGRVLEIYTTADGETWTLVLNSPDGISCVVAAGINWQSATPQKEEGT